MSEGGAPQSRMTSSGGERGPAGSTPRSSALEARISPETGHSRLRSVEVGPQNQLCRADVTPMGGPHTSRLRAFGRSEDSPEGGRSVSSIMGKQGPPSRTNLGEHRSYQHVAARQSSIRHSPASASTNAQCLRITESNKLGHLDHVRNTDGKHTTIMLPTLSITRPTAAARKQQLKRITSNTCAQKAQAPTQGKRDHQRQSQLRLPI